MSTSLGKHVTLTKPDDFGKLLEEDRKSTRLNSSHDQISYAVFCLKKKNSYTMQCQRSTCGLSAPCSSITRIAPLSSTSSSHTGTKCMYYTSKTTTSSRRTQLVPG